MKKYIYLASYFFYLLICFEIFSYLYIEYFIDSRIKEKVMLTLGNKNESSPDISWMKADLWSNYKPNPLSSKVNEFGFRFGGGQKRAPIRILCIGGSTTWGSEVEESKDTYPAKLENYLNKNNFNVEVINAGVPYHTSLEVLTRFLTNTIYTNPDILLVHTGGNDIGPLIASKKYNPDYSHWRDLRSRNNDKIFVKYWNLFPLSIIRTILIHFYKPGNGTSTGIQSTNLKNDLIFNNNLNLINPIGLKNYFKSILVTAKSSGIKPITILFNSDHNRKNSYTNRRIKNDSLNNFAVKRVKLALQINNQVMDSISNSLSIPIINYDKWKPSNENLWVDHCHLNEMGIEEKAIFIGNYLINNNLIQK